MSPTSATQSATSESIGLVGLRNTATKNKLTDTVVPLWDLQSTSNNIPSAESFKSVNPGTESVVGNDERQKVPKEHFMPGGKYRSIVKIFSRHEKQKPDANWQMGTGWLIRPDLLVTAGHCVFDWGHNLGQAVQIKAYIGYSGQGSIKDPKAAVQFRFGKRVATTLEWLTAKGNRNFDLAFVQLETPFTGVVPFKFADTPIQGSLSLGVVGYPGDLRDKAGEAGAEMYEMFLQTNYNLAESQWRMLEYEIDTFGGNSGAPVLRESDHVSIGVHVYGGAPNSASVIGLYGNPFLDYVAAFDLHARKIQLPGATSTPGIQYVTVPTSKTPDVLKGPVDLTHGGIGRFTREHGFDHTDYNSNQTVNNGHNGTHHRNGNHQNGNNHYNGGHHNHGTHDFSHTSHSSQYGNKNSPLINVSRSHDLYSHPANGISSGHSLSEEGFFDFLKQGVKIGGPLLDGVLSTGLPMVLGPLGGPVSALASVAISAAGKLAESHTGAESFGDPTEGVAERAILAEAAFTAMMKMDKQKLAEEGFFDDMRKVISKVGSVVKNVAPKVLDVVAEPTLRLALDALNKGPHAGAEGFYAPTSAASRAPTGGAKRSTLHLAADSGAEAFMARLAAASSEDSEGFFDFLGGIASKAIKSPVLMDVAKHGLPLLQSILTESAFENEAPPPVMAPMEGLRERAVLGEAALQAAMKAPQHILEEEGFFDIMASVVSKVGPVVMKAAPHIIKAVSPIVSGIIKQSGGTESLAVPRGGLRKMVSNVSLRGDASSFGANSDFWNHAHAVHSKGESFAVW